MKHLIIFLFMTAAIGCLPLMAHAQEHIMERHIILIYGLPPEAIYTNSQNVVAGKWGLEFRAIAGCVVTGEFVDSVDRVNSKPIPYWNRSTGKTGRIDFTKKWKKNMLKNKWSSGY